MAKRIVVAHYGGPETLQVIEEEWPQPKRGQVLVRVLAAGVALPDVLAREGDIRTLSLNLINARAKPLFWVETFSKGTTHLSVTWLPR